MHSNNRFFIIKSYTDEDVHKAIKYSIWSSNAKGNEILDQAWLEVESFRKENPKEEAEVYLLFSVNKSK